MPIPFSPKNAPTDIRKNPRFHVKSLHRITIQFSENGVFFRIANISMGGLGFFLEHNPVNLDDKILMVQLNIENKKFKVQIEIAHRGDKIIGCAFKDPDPQLLSTIENYFKTELLALKMNMVETRDEVGSTGKTIYFIGQNNCELLIQEIDGVLHHFGMILFGNYIEGDDKNTLCIGEKIGSELVLAPPGVHLYKPIPTANHHLIESAMRFIDNVQGLSDKRKESILKPLSLAKTTKAKS